MDFVKSEEGSECNRTMFDKFTEGAIKVIMLAQEEARRLGHNSIGTELILVALVLEHRGLAAKALKSAVSAAIKHESKWRK